MELDDLFETAHISISTANLKVVVRDVYCYTPLFFPRHLDNPGHENIFEEDPEWKKELKFPDFVLGVSPWFEDMTLSVFVEWPFDLKILADWLKTFDHDV